MKTTTVNDIGRFAGTVLHGRDEIVAGLGDLAGQRVALLGDPRAVSSLVARLAHHADALVVFQAEGRWVLPRLAGAVPLAGSLLDPLPAPIRRRVTAEIGRLHLRRNVADAWTRRQLAPRATPSRSSVVYSDRYHRALRRSDVRLVTWPVAGIVAEGVRTADGLEHHVDVIADATVMSHSI